MTDNKLTLTTADMNAIAYGDANFINNKGANLYVDGTYDKSVEYYRLAAAMGNVHAVSNLGYCYLYGRSIEANTSLAIAYFKVAAVKGDVDAAYKLGDVYSGDKWGVKDTEMSLYYYRMAASFVIGTEWEEANVISWRDELQEYPSLCFALGRELSKGGAMCTNIDQAYQFLKHAQIGYEKALANENSFYEKPYQGVMELLASSQFDSVREKYDSYFEDDEDFDGEE